MEKHLQDRQHYEELYDRMTVEDCLQSEDFFLGAGKNEEDELLSNLKTGVAGVVWEIKRIHLTLDWYNRKEETINEWMNADARYDEMLASASPPNTTQCNECSSRLNEESRSTWERDGKEEVIFFMKCESGHLPMKVVFTDGKELKIKDRKCPQCDSIIKSERLPSSKDEIKTKDSCLSCDYSDIDTFSLSKEVVIYDAKYRNDRERFCLSGETLKEAQEAFWNMERMKNLVDSWKHEEEHKVEYDAVSRLEKLTIPQVKELILKTLENHNYRNLTFEKPEIQKYVAIEFSLEEMKTDNENVSTSNVQKLIKTALVDTNWRLMSTGITYRLGLMTGRLRAYETKEDLLKLVK